MSSTATRAEVARALPGDELVPDAGLVLDRATTLAAAPDAVWPWIVQLGKGRAGWYMPARIEPWLVWSSRRRAATGIDARWQHLAVGEIVPDYGGQDAAFEVVSIDPPRALVYRSAHRETTFSWALVLRESAGTTRLHLRLRGGLKSTGWKRAVIARGGELFDWGTVALMFAGLRERVER